MVHWLKCSLCKYKYFISDLHDPYKAGSDTTHIIVALICHLVRNLESPRKWEHQINNCQDPIGPWTCL